MVAVTDIVTRTVFVCNGREFHDKEAAIAYVKTIQSDTLSRLYDARNQILSDISYCKQTKLPRQVRHIHRIKSMAPDELLDTSNHLDVKFKISGIPNISYYSKRLLKRIKRYLIEREQIILHNNILEYRELRRKLNELNSSIKAAASNLKEKDT